MSGRTWGTTCIGVALAFLTVSVPRARAAEVRVISGPGAATTVTIEATPDVGIEDRTPGAKPAVSGQGPASTGETFAGELTLFLRGLPLSRPAAIEVDDPVVSVVRMFPEAAGATVSVFVRQPVTYSIARPSPAGDVRIELHGRARAVTIVPTARPGRTRFTAPKPTGEREVAVDAESLSYDQATNTLTARGGVTVSRQDLILTADEVVYDRTNGIIEARGHVVLEDPRATVDGDFAHLDLEDETGWIENATADMHVSRYVVSGNRLEKIGGPRYSVADGVFTTCKCGGIEKPSWSILGTNTDVTLQGVGVVHGMTFRVKDVPVLWVPYMFFPAGTERASGFLFPRLGYSNKRGFTYEQPYYWAINKSSDATIAPDIQTNVRAGIVGEYRYILSQQARGAFVGAYYNESWRPASYGAVAPNGLPTSTPVNRFGIFGRHTQPLPDGSRFYLDVAAVSDDVFLKEINPFSGASGRLDDVGIRTARFTTNRAGVYKGWGEGYANFETAYYQDLIDTHLLTPQKLPRLDAEHSISLLDDHVVARFAGQGIDYQREEANGGLRADLAPDVFVPFHLGRVLQGSVTGQVRETAYHLTDREQVAIAVPDTGLPASAGPVRAGPVPADRATPLLPLLPENRARELAEVNARLGSELDRIFTFRHFGFEKLKHTIEPEVQYLYIPQVSNIFDQTHATIDCGELPGGKPGHTCPVTLFGTGFLFDARDVINRRNFVSYGLTSRVLGRGPVPVEPPAEPPSEPQAPDFVGPPLPPSPPTPPPPPATAARELVRASVLQGFDVSRPLVADRHLSDVDLGLRLTPVDYLALSYNSTLSTASTLRGMTFSVLGRDPSWQAVNPLTNLQVPGSAFFAYNFVEKGVNSDVQNSGPEQLVLNTAGVNDILGGLYVPLGKYLGFAFSSRYTFNSADKISSSGKIETDAAGNPLQTGPHFLERDYLLRIISRCNCWVIEAGFADKFNPDERQFRIQFTLVGLGSFGPDPLRKFIALTPLTAYGLGSERGGFGTRY
jgi:LPS-assembly protein